MGESLRRQAIASAIWRHTLQASHKLQPGCQPGRWPLVCDRGRFEGNL
ncbi:MAG: hypothetical protein MUC60_05855 [Oscillatoria sp. Prado101]|nr:hypothetical protein [Oscillatoria sp. Prado101]